MEVNEMLYFKACPRCQGDMHINRDMYGEYKECLQCGYMLDMAKANSLFSLTATTTAKTRKKVA